MAECRIIFFDLPHKNTKSFSKKLRYYLKIIWNIKMSIVKHISCKLQKILIFDKYFFLPKRWHNIITKNNSEKFLYFNILWQNIYNQMLLYRFVNFRHKWHIRPSVFCPKTMKNLKKNISKRKSWKKLGVG